MAICSLITIYNPDIQKLKQNIITILQYSDVIYLLFNSPIIEELLVGKKIIGIDNKKNIGVSKAINKGIEQCVKDGYNYALLFDQDSYLSEENFAILFDQLKLAEQEGQKISCIGPSLSVRDDLFKIPDWVKNKKITINTKNVCSVKHIITSGMIINIKFFLELGGFDERFPLDFCDFLFCWKSIYYDYLVLQSTNSYMLHEIGKSNLKVFKEHSLLIHAPFRGYFFIREALNISLKIKETPLIMRFRCLFLLPVRICIILITQDKKKLQLKMYWLGFKDFLFNRYGFGSLAHLLNAE